MKRCAYLTMREPGDFVTDYAVSFEPMAARGWQVDTVVWDDPSIHWHEYDAVYICTPWDYPEKPELFLRVLEAIDASPARLFNDLSLVRWNLEKTYLRDLEALGAAIVPSLWFDEFDARAVQSCFPRLGTDTVVIKPQLGANAADTFVLVNPVPDDTLSMLGGTFAGRGFVVQPFMEKIRGEGEYSLFFFDGEFSHAIQKVPASGDFRTQEEHGADIRPVRATEDLIDAARRVLAHVDPTPVYVRADFVRDDQDRFLLMELELIEPSLYLRTDSGAAGRFAAAFDKRFKVLAGK